VSKRRKYPAPVLPGVDYLPGIGPNPTHAQQWCYWYKKQCDYAGEDYAYCVRVLGRLRRSYPHYVRYLVDEQTQFKWGKELVFRDGSIVTMRDDQPGYLHASMGRLLDPQPAIILLA